MEVGLGLGFGLRVRKQSSRYERMDPSLSADLVRVRVGARVTW